MPRGKKTILTAAQEKTVALSSLAKYESNFEESGILHLFAQYEVELSISAEIGEKIRRKTNPKKVFRTCCRVLCIP